MLPQPKHDTSRTQMHLLSNQNGSTRKADIRKHKGLPDRINENGICYAVAKQATSNIEEHSDSLTGIWALDHRTGVLQYRHRHRQSLHARPVNNGVDVFSSAVPLKRFDSLE